jgi:putative membrane protein
MPFFVAVLGNAIGLLAAVWLLPKLWPGSIVWTGTIWELLIAGAVIGIINGILKPILKLLSLPLLFLTAGLFGIIINVGLIWLADLLLPDLTINGIPALFATTVILALVHLIL